MGPYENRDETIFNENEQRKTVRHALACAKRVNYRSRSTSGILEPMGGVSQ